MIYYKIVLSGADIFFENYSNPDPVIGFIACRLINAPTEALAIATAKRDVLVDWNHSFNADRKLGMPKLQIEHIEQVKGWFKPKASNDYYWFTDDTHKQAHIDELLTPPKKWFWVK